MVDGRQLALGRESRGFPKSEPGIRLGRFQEHISRQDASQICKSEVKQGELARGCGRPKDNLLNKDSILYGF